MQASQIEMERKKVLITGATDGIGLHTAKQLAKLGADVLVHGRQVLYETLYIQAILPCPAF
jgi:NAD(P)-dependent dehydrogenase (short-subunit alcohol dehydrogenase family)